MVVDVLDRLERRVSEPVADVVECVPLLDIEHPVSDAVTERVGITSGASLSTLTLHLFEL